MDVNCYQSILDLRADRILNWLSIADFDRVDAVFPVQYERMVRNGTASLIQNLEQTLGIRADCTPHPPSTKHISREHADPAYLPYMLENVNWEREALIGYSPTDSW